MFFRLASVRYIEEIFRARPPMLTGGFRGPDQLIMQLVRDGVRAGASEAGLVLHPDGIVAVELKGMRDHEARAIEWQESLARPSDDIVSLNDGLHIVRLTSEAFEVSWSSTEFRARFRPSHFPDRADAHALLGTLRDVATAHAGLTVSIDQAATGLHARLRYPRGALDRLYEECPPYGLGHLPCRWVGAADGLSFDAAFAWRRGFGLQVVALVNEVRSPRGGTHVAGIWDGIAMALDERVPRTPTRRAMTGADVACDAVLVVSVHLDSPRFAAATHDELDDPRAVSVITPHVAGAFWTSLNEQLSAESDRRRLLLAGHSVDTWVEKMGEALRENRRE